MTTSEPQTTPQTTPQPPQGLPEIEPLSHVRLTPAWQDPNGEAVNFWLLEVPGVPGETAEMRMTISERHVVELLVTFGKVIFDGPDGKALEALRALLVARASEGGAR